MFRPARLARWGETAFKPRQILRDSPVSGGAGAGCYEFHVGRGLAAPGSVMKSLIKNVLIGFGVGLVLMTGLALVTGGGKAQSSMHAPH
jgi:hypothetical protein